MIFCNATYQLLLLLDYAMVIVCFSFILSPQLNLLVFAALKGMLSVCHFIENKNDDRNVETSEYVMYVQLTIAHIDDIELEIVTNVNDNATNLNTRKHHYQLSRLETNVGRYLKKLCFQKELQSVEFFLFALSQVVLHSIFIYYTT